MENKKLISDKKDDGKETKEDKQHSYTVDLLNSMLSNTKKHKDELRKRSWDKLLKRK